MLKRKDLTIKDTKEIQGNRFFIPILFIVISVGLEVLQFKMLGLDSSFPTVYLFDICAILIIAGIIYLVKKTPAMLIVFFVFIGLQMIVNVVNLNLYYIFKDLFTFDYLFLGDEATGAFSSDFLDYKSILIYLAILLFIIIIIVLLCKYNKLTLIIRKWAATAICVGVVILFEIIGVALFDLTIQANEIERKQLIEDNHWSLWDNLSMKLLSYEGYGYYGFYFRNLQIMLGVDYELSNEERSDLLNFIQEGKTSEEELDNSLNSDNMIVILCESLDTFAIDPINTPFLYELSNGGACNFTNFYAHNKTNISEAITLTGNYPKSVSYWSLVNVYGYDYSYTLPKLFKEQNPSAQVNYLHSWTEDYYDRNIIYSNDGVGFDNLYFIEDYTGEKSNEFGNWIREESFVDQFADEIVPKEDVPFLTCYATVSTHGSYNIYKKGFEDLYQLYDENFSTYIEYYKQNYNTEVLNDDIFLNRLRNYKVAAMDLDRSIKKIFELLEERGKLDNTTVLLHGDHNAYYHDLCYTVKGIDKLDNTKIEQNNVPLIIYNSKLQSGNYDQFCSTLDIFPTLCEEHGLKYNKNLVNGYNVFSSDIENSVFVSYLADEVFTDKLYSNNLSDVDILALPCSETEIEKFKQLARNFYIKQNKIEKIYGHNLAK